MQITNLTLGEGPESKGFTSYPEQENGEKTRSRPESFSNHYSQARLFYISQTKIEQNHIRDALVFELRKVASLPIRTRMVSHLLNIDEKLAVSTADLLGLSLPKAAVSISPIKNLKKAPSLSILANNPNTFKGRKLGVVVTENIEIKLLVGLKKAVQKEMALMEIIAPKIGGIKTKEGIKIEAQHIIDNGSVFFDAVVFLLDAQADEKLMGSFALDAIKHAKFIAYTQSSLSLLKKITSKATLDKGFFKLQTVKDCEKFIIKCRKLRFWERLEK